MLAQFPNLKELNLSDNELTNLPEDLSRLGLLQNMNLNGNNFDDVIFAIIIRFYNVVHLNCLCFEKSTITEKPFHKLTLRRLSGSDNEITF